MAIYREVDLTLDALDLAMIETLIKARQKELEEFKAQHEPDSIPAMLADEQLDNYRTTIRKIRLAQREMKDATRNGKAQRKVTR